MILLLACSGKPAGDETGETGAVETADTGGGGDSPVDTVRVDTSNAGDDSDESGGNGGNGGDTGDPPPPPSSYLPLAPDADHVAWQGLTDRLLDDDGNEVPARVTVAVGGSAVCYAASDRTTRCAGLVSGVGASTTFTTMAVGEAEQLFVSPADSNGSSVCAIASERLTCTGSWNSFGQLGFSGSSSGWIAGARSGVVRAATGTWDQLCTVDTAGEVYCAGYSFGTTPASQGAGAWTWIDLDGLLHVDDSRTWRASPSRSEATLGSRGLDSDNVTARYGKRTGEEGLVDVIVKQRFPDGVNSSWTDELCTLDTAGEVLCTHLDPANGFGITEARFVGKRVVLLAAGYTATTLCAVVDDGSLWCLGDNDHGQLGRGDTADLTVETEVVLAGGVRLR